MATQPEPLYFSVDKIKVVMLFSESLFSKKKTIYCFRLFAYVTKQIKL